MATSPGLLIIALRPRTYRVRSESTACDAAAVLVHAQLPKSIVIGSREEVDDHGYDTPIERLPKHPAGTASAETVRATFPAASGDVKLTRDCRLLVTGLTFTTQHPMKVIVGMSRLISRSEVQRFSNFK